MTSIRGLPEQKAKAESLDTHNVYYVKCYMRLIAAHLPAVFTVWGSKYGATSEVNMETSIQRRCLWLTPLIKATYNLCLFKDRDGVGCNKTGG
jgi:hypothetical protein